MVKSRAKSKRYASAKKARGAKAPQPVALDLGPTDGIGPPAALVAVRAWLRVARGLLASRAGWTKAGIRRLQHARSLPPRAALRTLLARLERRQAGLADLQRAEVDRLLAELTLAHAAERSALADAIVALRSAADARPRGRAPAIRRPTKRTTNPTKRELNLFIPAKRWGVIHGAKGAIEPRTVEPRT